MAEKSYDEIMRMIIKACNNRFYSGTKDEKKTVIECATQIYITHMNTRTPKERGECSCKGNREKCDFDPEVRKKAKQLNLEYRDKKELEFYRWWVTEHNLNVEVATAFEKWLKDII